MSNRSRQPNYKDSTEKYLGGNRGNIFDPGRGMAGPGSKIVKKNRRINYGGNNSYFSDEQKRNSGTADFTVNADNSDRIGISLTAGF